jgi:hypothetical protein
MNGLAKVAALITAVVDITAAPFELFSIAHECELRSMAVTVWP